MKVADLQEILSRCDPKAEVVIGADGLEGDVSVVCRLPDGRICIDADGDYTAYARGIIV